MQHQNQNIMLVFRFVLIFILIMQVSVISYTQPRSLPRDPESAPIDGGLSLLVAAGVGFGIKRIKERNEKK